MSLEEYYNYLSSYELVSVETLDIITAINGYNEDTLNDILYVVSGYHDIQQYLLYEDKETYNEYYNEDKEEYKN